MMKINCELSACSDVEHLQQIYAGFNMLHRSGFLNLRQTIPPESLDKDLLAKGWTDYKFYNTRVVINDRIRVCYDLHDWNWIDEDILRETDFYFKRSYDAEFLSPIEGGNKVFPLGLNYPVTSPGTDLFKLERAKFYPIKDRVKTIVKSLRIDKMLGTNHGTENLQNLEALPDFTVEPRIIFMARAWDTAKIDDKKQRETVEAINLTRAECIRTLRKEFGSRFFGGLAREDYTIKNFKDCLLPNDSLSNKKNYLKLLKDYPICVTTTGLNRSNGWKLGEYVALSKAIITEPLHFAVPGEFTCQKNYLEFTNPSELIETAIRLFDNKTLRYSMMSNNYHYYLSFVRPDSIILNTLEIIFGQAKLN